MSIRYFDGNAYFGCVYVGQNNPKEAEQVLIKAAVLSKWNPLVPWQSALMNRSCPLELAIAAATNQKYEIARAALRLESYNGQGWGAADDVFFVPETVPIETQIACLAFAYQATRLTHSRVNRSQVRAMLAKIVATGFLPTDEQTKYRENLLHRLDLTIDAPHHPRGSPEALVDSLVESRVSGGQLYGYPDAIYNQFARLGFSGIPLAIDHLGDYRLTRGIDSGGGASGSHIFLIDDLMFNFLVGISNFELYAHNGRLTTQIAEEWWSKQQGLSEEEFLIRHLVPPNHFPSGTLVAQQLVAKYPDAISRAIAITTRDASGATGNILDEILRSRLRTSLKRQILE